MGFPAQTIAQAEEVRFDQIDIDKYSGTAS